MLRPLALCGALALAACAPGSPECLNAASALGKAAQAVTAAEQALAVLTAADVLDDTRIARAERALADARTGLTVANLAHAAACGG